MTDGANLRADLITLPDVKMKTKSSRNIACTASEEAVKADTGIDHHVYPSLKRIRMTKSGLKAIKSW